MFLYLSWNMIADQYCKTTHQVNIVKYCKTTHQVVVFNINFILIL